MKRNRLFILGIVTVLVALLSLTLVSGTYAKYTSTATGSDTARVAKWDVEVNNDQLGKAGYTAFVVNLFQSAGLKDTDGTAESDVTAKSGSEITQLIAPGTKGSFEFNVYNASEVTAAVVLTGTLANDAGVPLVWSLKSKTGSAEYAAVATDGTFADIVTEVNATLGASLPANQAASAAVSFEVTWEWPYEAIPENTDALDTAKGLAGTATVTASFTVTATQVD